MLYGCRKVQTQLLFISQDDLLYYLNNHRGGFFRFFNGGAVFGDDSNYNYQHTNQQNNYQNNYQYQQQQASAQQSTASNLASLQSLADAINQSDGINLSNLASNGGLLSNLGNLAGLVGGNGGSGGAGDLLSLFGGNAASDASGSGASGLLSSLISGGNVAPSNDVTNGGAISLLSGLAQNSGSNANLGSVVGNLLTGFIGNRFSSRKINKRSVEEVEENDEKEPNVEVDEKNVEEIASQIEANVNDTKELSDIEPRIVHGKLPILSALHEPSISNIKFSDDDEIPHRSQKQIKFDENDGERINDSKKSFFTFPSIDIAKDNKNVIFPSPSSDRTSKKIKFFHTDSNAHFFPDDHQSFNEINDPPQRIKMVFPDTDRTGTGNLIFDSQKFHTNSTRVARILSGLRVLQQLQQVQQLNGNPNRIHFDTTTTGTGGNNRYDSTFNANPLYSRLTASPGNNGYQQSFPNRYTTNQQANNHRFGNQNYNINYNSQSSSNNNGAHSGNDDFSQNVYVTNGNGDVEYYINSAGVKVYV